MISTKKITRRTILEFDALCFEVFCQWKDNGVVLVKRRAINSLERINSWDFLNKAAEISSKLYRAVLFLECKPS